MIDITMSAFEISDAEEVHALIQEDFDKFISKDIPKDSRAIFDELISADGLIERASSDSNIWLAKKMDGTIAGMIEIRNRDHIALLFVRKNLQKKGVGTKLAKFAIAYCNETYHVPAVNIESSLYAVPAFEKMGFKKLRGVEHRNGVRFQPMIFTIEYHL